MLPLEENTAREAEKAEANRLVAGGNLEVHVEKAIHDRGHGVEKGSYGYALFRIGGEVDD